MKNQLLAIVFYLIYFSALIKPVIPVIDYFVNYNYIAKVLCENRNKPVLACNGKCYLQKQIEETQDFEHNLVLPIVNLKDFPVTTIQNFIYNFTVSNFIESVIHLKFEFYNFYFSPAILKPPIKLF